jgi:hypothetical protein
MTTTTKNPTTNTTIDLTHLENLTTISAKIRYLNDLGIERGQIAKILGIRYQWVRNVLITPIKTPKK